ncbi:DUF418 domain-containing protein [Streptomyces sp. NPDC054796]
MRIPSPGRPSPGTDAAPGTGPGPGRIREVDVLRGFALLGILLVNAQNMAGPHVGEGGAPVASWTDDTVAWLVTALASGKFYLLFSFLFGYSFTLQRASAERAGASFAPRHLRRLGCLFLLGLAHAVLLYPGDVLTIYAVLSLVLFALRDITPRVAVRVAACLVVAVAACLLVWGLLMVTLAEPPRPGATSAALRDLVSAYRGDPGSVVAANLRQLHSTLSWNALYGIDMLAAFLAGLAAGRRGLLTGTGAHRARMVRILAVTLPVGLVGGVVMAVCRKGPLDARWYDVGSAVGVLTAPALTATYVCGLLLLVHTGPGTRIAEVLSGSGRLALTHYLSQSLVMALVFTGYGLGLYGRYGAAVVVAGCFVLYGAQLALGAWMSRRFRYGPVEWLLRAATLAHRP